MPTDQRFCIDSDALVNLLALSCLKDALTCLRCSEESCFRLPSIVAQLKRARWVGERWPKADRAAMAFVAEKLPVLPPPQNIEVQKVLNAINDIDEGEAYILAKAVEDSELLVLTGDGRMIRALHRSAATREIRESLRGRLLIFPQIVGALAKALSISEVEYRWRLAAPETTKQRQKSLSVMFGSTSPTSSDDFWSGYKLQVSNVTDMCGGDWLYPL